MSDPIRKRDYICTKCGRNVGVDNLKAKNVSYRTMGAVRRTERTRAVAWLCTLPQENGDLSCLDQDPDYHREAFVHSPGLADTRLAKEPNG